MSHQISGYLGKNLVASAQYTAIERPPWEGTSIYEPLYYVKAQVKKSTVPVDVNLPQSKSLDIISSPLLSVNSLKNIHSNMADTNLAAVQEIMDLTSLSKPHAEALLSVFDNDPALAVSSYYDNINLTLQIENMPSAPPINVALRDSVATLKSKIAYETKLTTGHIEVSYQGNTLTNNTAPIFTYKIKNNASIKVAKNTTP